MALGTPSDEESSEQLETPIDPFDDFCLNPNGEEAPKNPLCPVCEREIKPVSDEVERRFECGCEETWKFVFRSD